MRFLFYAVASMTYLEYLMLFRCGILWRKRDLPSYLGPSPAVLISLALYLVLNFVTLFALTVMFLRSLWSLCTNVTTIESWEIERHKTLLRRSRALGGYLEGSDGSRIRIARQEFPYDVGIWKNITQGMHGGPIFWLWPLTAISPVASGLSFEVNEFEDPWVTWPPPDPDRVARKPVFASTDNAFTHQDSGVSNKDHLDAFRQRQQEDLKRYQVVEPPAYRRKPFHQRYKEPESDKTNKEDQCLNSLAMEGEEAWRNSEGDRLNDFGVDEDVEFYDEDDVPLAELLSRRGAERSRLPT
ncbi:Palmitoyltransferase [Xylographa bjoerkii]|nr:Palmitoyltransferase [Xylographa bjoerkii]